MIGTSFWIATINIVFELFEELPLQYWTEEASYFIILFLITFCSCNFSETQKSDFFFVFPKSYQDPSLSRQEVRQRVRRQCQDHTSTGECRSQSQTWNKPDLWSWARWLAGVNCQVNCFTWLLKLHNGQGWDSPCSATSEFFNEIQWGSEIGPFKNLVSFEIRTFLKIRFQRIGLFCYSNGLTLGDVIDPKKNHRKILLLKQ